MCPRLGGIRQKIRYHSLPSLEMIKAICMPEETRNDDDDDNELHTYLHGSNHYSVWHKKIFALAVDCSLASFSFFLIGGVTRNNVILFIINIKKHSL